MMEPRIVELEAIRVMGTLTRVDYTEGTDFGAIWDAFMAHHNQTEAHTTDKAHYGVSFATANDGVVDYLAAMAVEPSSNVPAGLTGREVPAARYAVFEFAFKDMHSSIEYALHRWLPASPYGWDRTVSVTDFLHFPPGNTTGEALVLFYVPVRESNAPRPDGT